MKLFISIITVTLLILSSCSSQKKTTPNVIFIMADDLGYGEVGSFGASFVKTPNIDFLSDNGIKYTDFHTNGSVCSPTRAALLTGLYQQRTGVTGVVTARYHRHHGLPTSFTTIAEVMKSGGYKTGIFGKWHVGYDVKYNPTNHGFDKFIGYVGGNIDFHSHLDQEGFKDWWLNKEVKEEDGYCTDLITKHATEFISENADNPFFMYMPYEPPHYPYQGRDDGAQRELVDGKNGYFKTVNPNKDYNKRDSYIEMIEVMDEGVGAVIETLKKHNIYDNTVIVFCSDNGPAGGVVKFIDNPTNGLRGAKSTIYEGGHRVPGIFFWPKNIKPSVCDETIMTMDMLPTIAKIAGITENLPLTDGIDISPTFSGGKLPERDLFWMYKQGVIRRGDLKLIIATKELFNLKADIGETNNLYANEEHTELISSMLDSYNKMVANVAKNAPKPAKSVDTRVERNLE